MMPDIDGISLTTLIKGKLRKHIPMILLSAKNTVEGSGKVLIPERGLYNQAFQCEIFGKVVQDSSSEKRLEYTGCELI